MRLVFAALIILAWCSSGYSQATEEEFARMKQKLIVRWNILFSPVKLDDRLFECMDFIDPQPESAFHGLDGKQIDNATLYESSWWFEDLFTADANPYNHKIKPSKYYLPNEDRALAKEDRSFSLLFYEWNNGFYAFKIMESYSAVLVRIRPIKDFHNLKSGIPASEVAQIIQNVVNLDRLPNTEPLVKRFHLPEHIFPGSVFSNAEKLDVRRVGSWRKAVVVLICHNDVCIFVFKAHGGRALAGIPLNPKWLDELR